MKYESVFTIQRVPKTESQGRIQASSRNVQFSQRADEIDIQISQEDLRIVCAAHLVCGQCVNTTYSAVRVLSPANKYRCSVSGPAFSDSKCEGANANASCSSLRDGLERQQAEAGRERLSQIGHSARSKIARTTSPQDHA